MPSISPLRLCACFSLLAALLVACSPTFNWREVPIGGTDLVALLPCKAERASRELPLGGEQVAVEMAGCETGGATFAVAHAAARSTTQAEAWLVAWRAATRAQLAEAPAVESAGTLARAAPVPAPVRLKTQGDVALQVLWFAKARSDGTVALYQATVLGQPSASDAADTFFDGLRLP
ncbi:MAG: hypothetical protein EOP81_13275 [Variovorax sp.]|nr:MAG: hypothetical protein EOP81_13275 [Variovorax sp.]